MPKKTIKSGNWFRTQPAPREPGPVDALIKLLIGGAIGGLAFALGTTTLTVFIWIVAGAIGIITLGSRQTRTGVGRFFATIGRWFGWTLGIALSTPVYLIGFTLAHLVSRLSGRDPLLLRDKSAPTFWLPADSDRRKVRHIRSLFATETTIGNRGRSGLVVGLAAAAVLLVTAELLLRMLGFGDPILYVPDAQAGYYPGPEQDVYRYGSRVATNRFGMRCPDFELEKAPDTLRILMVGDSTLWGGSDVDQPDIYPRLLEDALNGVAASTDQKPNRVEILNVAANGSGALNKAGSVDIFGTFDADVAVICMPIGDIYRGRVRMEGVPYFSVSMPPRLALEELLAHLNWRTRAWGRTKKTLDPDKRLVDGERGIRNYVALAEKLRDEGCEVLVEVLPSRSAATTDDPPHAEMQAFAKLRAALQERGFGVVNRSLTMSVGILLLLMIGLVITAAQVSAPFIYTLF